MIIVLLGRRFEADAIDALLDCAREATAGTLVIAGEAGIGKTALLRWAADRAASSQPGPPLTVLRATGSQDEAHLPFAALVGLLRPIIWALAELAPVRAEALRCALGLSEPEAPTGAYTVAAATLDLLAAAAERQPVLVVADDLQWMDASSVAALLFAARRLHDDRVAILIGVRTDEPVLSQLTGLSITTLAGLSEATSGELLLAHGRRLAPIALERAVAATGGNPLALLQLDEIDATPLPHSGSDGPLPLTGRLESAFGRRLAGLDAGARLALGVLALSSAVDQSWLARALDDLGLDAEALDAGEQRGLIVRTGRGIGFTHPLVRAAAYAALSPGERRRAHAALARTVLDGADGDADADAVRAWHLSEAAAGADEAIARQLDDAAARAADRGDVAAAGLLHSRAARLSMEPSTRVPRLIAAARAAQGSGQPWAAAAIDMARREALEPRDRDAVELLGALHAAQNGDVAAVLGTAERVGDLCSPPVGATLHALAVVASWQNLDSDAMQSHARRALRLCGPGPRHVMVAVATELSLSVASGHGTGVAARVLPGLIGPDDYAFATPALQVLLHRDEFGPADRILASVLPSARRDHAVPHIVSIQATAAELAVRRGHLVEGRAAADEALALARASGADRLLLAHALTAHAGAAAAMGHRQECLRALAEVRAVIAPLSAAYCSTYADVLEATLIASLGGFADAAARFTTLLGRLDSAGFTGCGLYPVLPELVECLARAGRRVEARRHLADLLGRLADDPMPTIRVRTLRAAAYLTPSSRFTEAFSEADAAAVETGAGPVERGRIELLRGLREATAGRPADAVASLQRARVRLAGAGAGAWAAQADSALRRLGAPAPAVVRGLADLTQAERQIAVQAATGATNREIAAEVFLSTKSVEAYLTRVYRKTGVRSKTELAHYLSSATADPPTAHA